VAEGVETAAQLAVVRSLGISAGQGYLLGRPTDSMLSDRVDLVALESANDTDSAIFDVDPRLNLFTTQGEIATRPS
jgi:predicted signal transduction protein with EAL and GGDEF domain